MRVLVCAAMALLLAAGACGGGDGDDTGTAPAGPSAAPSAADAAVELPTVAPYLDIARGTADVSTIADRTGQKDFAVAFLLANAAGQCVPSWGGKLTLDNVAVTVELKKLEALAGRVIVATGGATGNYLENVCSAAQLAAAYASALTTVGTNFLDVDLEKPVTPATVITALAQLQADRGTRITLTLPVDGAQMGLAATDIALLRSVKAAGLEVTVNAKTMNFEADGDWGTAMTRAAEAVADDVAAVWPGLDDAGVYAMLGVTPMIGVNDTGAVTTVANAKTLLTYAKAKGLGFVRFWSVNRDNGGCPDSRVSGTCSGIAQTDYAFTSLFTGFKS